MVENGSSSDGAADASSTGYERPGPQPRPLPADSNGLGFLNGVSRNDSAHSASLSVTRAAQPLPYRNILFVISMVDLGVLKTSDHEYSGSMGGSRMYG